MTRQSRRGFVYGLLLAPLGLGVVNYRALTPSQATRRRVVFFFPEGKTFDDFNSELSRWIDIKVWHQHLDELKERGELISIQRTLYKNRVVYEYKFRDALVLTQFESDSKALYSVNENLRSALGYSVEVVYLA